MMEDPSQPSTVAEILKSTGLSSATVANWQKKDREFKKKYILAKRKMASKNLPQPEEANKNPNIRKTGWEDDFRKLYEATGRFTYSCEMVGVSPETVTKRLDPESSTYDPVFADEFALSEARLNRTLEDVAHERAIEEKSDVMIKFLLTSKVPRYGKTVTHNNIINAKVEYKIIEEKAQKFLEAIFGEVLEGEIVDSIAVKPRSIPASV